MKDCIFCKIVAGEIPTQFVYEDDQVVAFNDIQPAAPVHIILIPRIHIPSFDDIKPEHKGLMGHLAWVAGELARQKNISEKGYRLVMNCGPDGGQEVFHLHFHLLGGKPLASGYGRQ
ncbi:MAG: histidine triad nucleotide-binding protein [Firmicutes bacterium]|nr:histidine triad nucleotide-binding protein [Bacillota bacterium]